MTGVPTVCLVSRSVLNCASVQMVYTGSTPGFSQDSTRHHDQRLGGDGPEPPLRLPSLSKLLLFTFNVYTYMYGSNTWLGSLSTKW
ncbi:hypothetical protein Pmani_017439 [Petrolisthes manimaculis]|uniref:Uncharacterized protein n=1 Tax=Petrolisthes manimaculis TaxID=1843537 RepID=A0AAE1PPH9_9EUCA|nr:hypothetical protein Pmani_017439 [Petrolisthes manimaculis]